MDAVVSRYSAHHWSDLGQALREVRRVLRPGGALVIVDLDATAPPYGDWMRRDLPRYDPAAVERFFAAQGFEDRRVRTRWVFDDRRTLDAVLGIEFSRAVADRARREIAGTTVEVGYRIHVRRRTPLDRARGTTV